MVYVRVQCRCKTTFKKISESNLKTDKAETMSNLNHIKVTNDCLYSCILINMYW